MKKIGVLGVLLVLLFSPLRSDKIKCSSESVFRALLNSTQEVSEDFRGTSKKKKKFLKKLIKELVITTLNLALEAVVGSRRQLREDLCAVLDADGKMLEIDPKDLSLLFDELFMYYSEKLEDLQTRFEMKVLESYCETRSPEISSIDDDGACELCARVAIATVDKIDITDARVNWPAIWCFVKIIADIGELVLDQETKNKRNEFVKKVVRLVKDFREFLASDDLLVSFEKLSQFLTRVREVSSDSEVQKVVEQILASSKDGVAFLNELFSSVNLYLQDKLVTILSNLFRVSQETPSFGAK